MTRAVVVSDLHLLYDGTEVDAILQLMDELEDNPPDELILNGDVYELWRGDLAGNMWLSSEFTEMIVGLEERGVEVTYVQGNHDDWFSRHTDPARGYPLTQQLDYRTTLDGQDFFFTHGHKYEPTYIPPTNDLLSITNDWMGSASDWLWDNRPAPDNPAENAALTVLGPAGSYLNPDDLQTNTIRRDAIERGIRREAADGEWAIFGHTHTPYINEQERVANTGNITSGQATYIEIEGGQPALVDLFA